MFLIGIAGEIYTIKEIFVNQLFFIHLVSALLTAFGGSELLKLKGYGKSLLYPLVVSGLIMPWTGSLINIVVVLICLVSPYDTLEVDMPFKYDKKITIDPYENLVAGLGIDGTARVEASIQPVKDIFRYGSEYERRNLLSKAAEYEPSLHISILRRGLDDKTYALRTFSANLLTATEKKCTRMVNTIVENPAKEQDLRSRYDSMETILKYIYSEIWDKGISKKIIVNLEKVFNDWEMLESFEKIDDKTRAIHLHLRSRLDFLKGDNSKSSEKIKESLYKMGSYNLSIKDNLSIKFKNMDFKELYLDCKELLKKGTDNYDLMEAAMFFINAYESAKVKRPGDSS